MYLLGYEVKERVGLYLCSTSGPSWPVIGWTLPLPLHVNVIIIIIIIIIIAPTNIIYLGVQLDSIPHFHLYVNYIFS
jgi:hypothetical protein